MQNSRHSKNLALMFLLGALLVGGVLGFSVERWVLRTARAERLTPMSMREQLAGGLDMSADQRRRFDSILARRDARLDTLMTPVRVQMDAIRPRYRQIRDSARADIRALLSADQQRQFDRFMAELRAEEARKDSAAGRAPAGQ